VSKIGLTSNLSKCEIADDRFNIGFVPREESPVHRYNEGVQEPSCLEGGEDDRHGDDGGEEVPDIAGEEVQEMYGVEVQGMPGVLGLGRLEQLLPHHRFDIWWRAHARKVPTTVSTSGGALMLGRCRRPFQHSGARSCQEGADDRLDMW